MPIVRRAKSARFGCCASRCISTKFGKRCTRSAAVSRGPPPPNENTVELAPTVSASYHRIAMTRDGAPLVLIVEDDLETRRFYSDVLLRSGFAVDQAHNGHQALEKALASPP